MEVSIYIKTNLKGPAIRPEGRYLWLVAYDTKDKKIATVEGYGEVVKASELRLSLLSLCRAVRRIKPFTDINIYTDCSFLRENYRYLNAWKESDWKNGYLRHKELWAEIYARTDKSKVELYPLEGSEYALWMNTEMKEAFKRMGKNRS